MAAHSLTELDLFQDFLVSQFKPRASESSLDDAISAFRQYQQEMSELKEKLRVGVEQCERGQIQPLDGEAIKTKLRQRIADEGNK